MNKIKDIIRNNRRKYSNSKRVNNHATTSFFFIIIFCSLLVILQQYAVLLIFFIFLVYKYEFNILDILYVFINAYVFYISIFGVFIFLFGLLPRVYDNDDILYENHSEKYIFWYQIISRQLLILFIIPFLGGVLTPIWLCIMVLIFDINYFTFSVYDETFVDAKVIQSKSLREEILNYKDNKEKEN